MRLIVRRQQRTVALRSPLWVEVHMRFQAVLVPGERFVFVYVNFERILRGGSGETPNRRKEQKLGSHDCFPVG